jgi:epoxide hydrolase-like predicted phosphatase
MIKAIIFDCFGVVYFDVFPEVYTSFGGDIEKDREFLEALIFETSAGRMRNMDEQIAEHLQVDLEEWRKASIGTGRFNEELFAYIDDLRKSYKVSMLSNIGSNGLEKYMDTDVLWQHFDDVVESAKIGFAKPEARAFEIAAERLGVRLDECVFTDDRESYCEGATHVGMKAIHYKDFEQFKAELEKLLH